MKDRQNEIKRYDHRLSRIKQWDHGLQDRFLKLPEVPLDNSLSPRSLVCLNLTIFGLHCVRLVNQTILSFTFIWERGIFSLISLHVRLVFETWGAANYAKKTVLGIESTKGTERALEKSDKLLLGSRSQVDLPWGGKTDPELVKSIHVMDLIRSLSEDYPNTEDDYDFLCESSHPSFLMHSYWSLMGPIIHNWENPKFSDHAHALLDRTLLCLEKGLDGIYSDVNGLLKSAVPYIYKDQAPDQK